MKRRILVMTENMFGERKMKQMFLTELGEKPSISDSAVESLNTYLNNLVKFVLVKANEYRKSKNPKNPSKRLTSLEIDFAYKDFLLQQIAQTKKEMV